MRTTSSSFRVFAIVGFALTLLPAGASAQGTATVTGQVSNTATQAFLEGASVELAGTGRSAMTDREGRYEIAGVPVGAHTLVVRYAGLDSQTVAVTLNSGERAVRDVGLTSEIYRMEKVTVAGEREGTALAETLQRQAPNVKNIVSSDTFGRIADGNIAVLLQNVPGVYGAIDGTDVRGVQVRGVTTDLTNVTMDGASVASASSGLATRRFEFDQQSLNQIERIEVVKAPTPDMEGSSIGGTVNLVTKSVFSRAPGRQFSYSVGMTSQLATHLHTSQWKEPLPGISPSLSYTYSDVYGAQRNFGVTLTGTLHSLQMTMPVQIFQNEAKNEPGPVYTNNWSRREQSVARTRMANALKLEYRWSENTTLSLNTAYNLSHFMDQNPQITFATARTLATIDAAGNRIGGGAISPNYSDGITRIFPVANSTASFSLASADRSGKTILFAPNLRHRTPSLAIDSSLTLTTGGSHIDTGTEDRKWDSRPSGTLTASLASIGFNIDRSKRPDFPTLIQTAGPNLYDLNNYRSLLLTQPQSRGHNRMLSGIVNVRKDLAWTLPTFVKTGLSYNRQERKIWSNNRRFNFTGPDGILGNADDNQDIGQFKDGAKHIRDSKWLRYFQDPGGVIPFPSVFSAARHKATYPELWREDVAFNAQSKLTSDQSAIEEIRAAYVMGDVRLGKVAVLAGVRLEETQDDAEGSVNFISPEERARRAAWVGAVTDPEARRRAEAQYGTRRQIHFKYRDYFPGVHLRYEPFDGMLTRLSWSTAIGRPTFSDIMPNDIVNDETMRVTSNNPNLKPQHSDAFDFSIEYYLRPQGSISAGVFRKDIEDFIFTSTNEIIGPGPNNGFDGQYEGYAWTTDLNGGKGRIDGIEFNYQQQLTFLPGWAKGLGLQLNYTGLKTEGDYGSTNPIQNSELPLFIRKNGNISISYRGHGFELRLRGSYRGMQFATQSATPSMKQYRLPSWTTTWQSSYRISRTTSIFLDVTNIFSRSVGNQYLLYPDRISRIAVFSPVVTAGVSGRY